MTAPPMRPLPHFMFPKSILAQMRVEDTSSTPLWEILVPTTSNSGKPFSVHHHRLWDQMVERLAGGLTLIQPVRGTWVDPTTNETFVERMIPVRIMCTREQIIEICKETARFYDQRAVLASLVADQSVLVTNPNVRETTVTVDEQIAALAKPWTPSSLERASVTEPTSELKALKHAATGAATHEFGPDGELRPIATPFDNDED